jgi:hypothetical protein
MTSSFLEQESSASFVGIYANVRIPTVLNTVGD